MLTPLGLIDVVCFLVFQSDMRLVDYLRDFSTNIIEKTRIVSDAVESLSASVEESEVVSLPIV